MVASALNQFIVACILALVVAAGAARVVPEGGMDHDTLWMRRCHSNNGWSSHLCRGVCQASGFSRYDFTVPNMATGKVATCCCCPKGDNIMCPMVNE